MFKYSKTRNFNVFRINNNETCISQILTFLSPLEENPFGFEAKSDLNDKASKMMLNLTGASKTYLNDKGLINGQEIALIFLIQSREF